MSSAKPRVTIYTDGGADPNPGPGGWAAILVHDATGRVKELTGGEPYTTNNRMELTAAIRALDTLKQPCEVRFFTDSQYLKRGVTQWAPKWAENNWRHRRRKSQPVENADLWRALLALASQHEIMWEWVKAHAGDAYNERADWLAAREIRRIHAQQRAATPPDAEVYLAVSVREGWGLWVASVRFEGQEQLLTGAEPGATSNQLDILAAAKALSRLPEGVWVRVYSLSDYLRNGASRWIEAWKQRGWVTKKGGPVKNRELWERLDEEQSVRQVEWPPVKDDPASELVFEDMARRAQEAFEAQARREGDCLYGGESR